MTSCDSIQVTSHSPPGLSPPTLFETVFISSYAEAHTSSTSQLKHGLNNLQGKEYVPETVDHVCVKLDPHEDRSWLQSNPPTPTDRSHAFDKTGPNIDTPENWSEAVKRLKPRMLQRIIDTFHMDQCLIFCR